MNWMEKESQEGIFFYVFYFKIYFTDSQVKTDNNRIFITTTSFHFLLMIFLNLPFLWHLSVFPSMDMVYLLLP